MGLSSTAIKKVSSQIYRQFPEAKGVSPNVQKQRSGTTKSTEVYLLKYEANVVSASGKKIKRWIRVTVDENGKILRTSTSR